MICPSQDDLSLFLLRALPPDETRALDAHRADCARCRAELSRGAAIGGWLAASGAWDDKAAALGDACLDARELLAFTEGQPGVVRAVKHLEECTGCRDDLAALRESLDEHAQSPAAVEPELALRLRRLGGPKKAATPVGTDSTNDLLAPIVVASLRGVNSPAAHSPPPPVRAAEPAPSDTGRVRRGSARHARPSSVSPARVRRSRGERPAHITSLVSASAAAAAAIAIAALVATSRPTETPTNVAQNPPRPARPKVAPAPGDRPELTSGSNVPGKRPAEDETPAEPRHDEVVPPPPPQEPPSPEPAAPAPEPARGGGPGTTSVEPKKAEPAVAVRSRLEDPVQDDGVRIEVDLARAGGGFALRQAGEEKAVTHSRRRGTVSLKPGDRLRASNAGAFFAIREGEAGVGAELCLAPRTELVVRAARSGPVLGVLDGRLLCEVDKVPAGRVFSIATAHADFDVTGTVFAVQADAQKSSCVVEEGTVAARGLTGQPRSVKAGLGVQVGRDGGASEPAAFDAETALGWAKGLRPAREVVFEATFDRNDAAGFQGQLSADGARHGRGASLLLEPIQGNKYWGLRSIAPRGRMKALRADPDTRLTLAVFAEKETRCLVQLWNDRQQKLFKQDLGTVPAGTWRQVTVSLLDLETYYDPGQNPVREGDVFTELEVYQGEPGERFKGLIDDVVVYRKLYR